MTNLATPSSFSSAPPAYTQFYFNQLLNDLRAIIVQLNNPGAIVGTTLQLTQLPVTGAMLPVGSVFSDGGTLKITLDGVPYAPSLAVTTALGTPTVTVS